MQKKNKEFLILVDKNDNFLGVEEKIKAHKEGKLHRAFSVLIFNSKGELLLQKRAKDKYHSGELWSNTSCGHPREQESTENAARRRLFEEMGFDCELKEIFKFHYNVRFESGLIENEIDHVFIGEFNESPKPNFIEVEEYQWVSIKDLKQDISKNPDKYTVWFKEIINKIFKFQASPKPLFPENASLLE